MGRITSAGLELRSSWVFRRRFDTRGITMRRWQRCPVLGSPRDRLLFLVACRSGLFLLPPLDSTPRSGSTPSDRPRTGDGTILTDAFESPGMSCRWMSPVVPRSRNGAWDGCVAVANALTSMGIDPLVHHSGPNHV